MIRHANSETGAIFVHIVSAIWREDDNPPRGRAPGDMSKDGARFGVRERSWRSYGKIEDSKQSSYLPSFYTLLPPFKNMPNYKTNKDLTYL